MSTYDGDRALFVADFNKALAALPCVARVAAPKRPLARKMLELLDEDGQFLGYLPAEATPEMASFAWNLYSLGLGRGVVTGETAAWAKLRAKLGLIPSEAIR